MATAWAAGELVVAGWVADDEAVRPAAGAGFAGSGGVIAARAPPEYTDAPGALRARVGGGTATASPLPDPDDPFGFGNGGKGGGPFGFMTQEDRGKRAGVQLMAAPLARVVVVSGEAVAGVGSPMPEPHPVWYPEALVLPPEPAASPDSAASTPDAASERALVEATLRGDSQALRELVRALDPVVRVRVARVLYRYRGQARRRDVRQEADDLVQEAFMALLEHKARVLSRWDPARGLSLRSFVGLVAERTARDVLVSGRRNPWRDDPTEAEALDAQADDGALPERLVTSRDFAARLVDRLAEDLSPLGFRVFTVLFVEQLEVADACRELAMKADAIYAWRSRLTRRVRELAKELESSEPRLVVAEPSAAARSSPGEHLP